MDIEKMALLIPILGIVLGVGVAVVAIVTSHREKQKRAELRHRERLAAIEKGIELPLDPDPDAEPKKSGSSLKTGLINLFLGIVLYIAIAEVAGDDVAPVRPDSRRDRHREPDQLLRGRPQEERQRRPAAITPTRRLAFATSTSGSASRSRRSARRPTAIVPRSSEPSAAAASAVAARSTS
jgi:hypothetical protein